MINGADVDANWSVPGVEPVTGPGDVAGPGCGTGPTPPCAVDPPPVELDWFELFEGEDDACAPGTGSNVEFWVPFGVWILSACSTTGWFEPSVTPSVVPKIIFVKMIEIREFRKFSEWLKTNFIEKGMNLEPYLN